MGYILKTNTAVRVAVGPLVDQTDGITAETALTVTGLSVQLYQIKTDGSAVVRSQFNPTASSGDNDMALVTSSTDGMYDLELTAAQLNFLGNARISFYDVDGFCVHWIDIQVVSAAYFEWIFGTTKPEMNLADDAITSAKYDESTAFPIKSADTGATQIARTGEDGDTLETLSDEIATTDGHVSDTFDDVGDVKAVVDEIVADTNELQTDWVNGGRLDVLIDAILEDTGTTLPATLTAIAGYLDTEIAAILADTNELQTDWVNGGRLDLLIDAIKAKTDALPGSVWDYAYASLTTPDSIGEKFYDWFASVPVGETALGATDLVLINNALTLLGHDTLADLTGTDKATTICVQHYQQVVDAVLRAYQWNCAMTRSSELTAESTAPSFGYDYKYALPDGCLRVLRMQELDCKFKVEGSYLLTDEESAYILYIARISPASMDSLLKGAVSAALAATIAFPLTNSSSAAKQMWDLYQAKLDEARTTDAFEGTHESMQPSEDSDWIIKRS